MSWFSAVLEALVEPARQLGVPSLPQRLLDAVVQDEVAGRRAWIADGRAVIAAHGVHRPDSGPYTAALEAALEATPGVEWARVNAPLGRVVAAVGEDCSLVDLVGVVERVEREYWDFDDGGEPEARIDRSDAARAGVEVVSDLAGLALAGVARAVGFAPLVSELSATVSFVDNVPRVRAALEQGVGRPAADDLLTIATAGAQALTQGFVGLLVDLAAGVCRWSEAAAQSAAWEARRGAFFATAESSGAAPLVTERPRELPPGPVESWSNHTPMIAAGTLAVGIPATGSRSQGAALALSVMPKPARFGREGFATQLGRILAARGAVTTDPGALRRLDRIDTVVLDAAVLTTGRHLLGTVLPLPGVDSAEVLVHLHALFRADRLGTLERDGPWSLGPIEQLSIEGRKGTKERRLLAAGSPAAVLGLVHGERLLAVAAAVPEPNESLEALAAACRRAEKRLVVTSSTSGVGGTIADAVLPGGRRLVGTIRQLQADGAGVLLVSADRAALANADVGIGVAADVPAWGADIHIDGDLALAALVIDASGTAAAVSRRAVRLAQGSLALAGVAATAAGSPVNATGRAMLAVNTAAALALAMGAFSAHELARRPLDPPVSLVPWHAMPPRAVLEHLHTSTDGLAPDEVRRRARATDRPGVAPTTLTRAVVEELVNPLTPILGGGAALSAAIGAIVDSALVVGVTLASAIIGGLQRRSTDRALDALLKESAVTARVRRQDGEQIVPADELVPGDILLLGPREVVPADCRILEAAGLEADESSLTGEPFPVSKTVAPVLAEAVADRRSMLHEGTTVAAGRATVVVVATGTSTEAGRTVAATRQGTAGGVEARLSRITRITLPITLASAVAVVVSGLARGLGFAATAATGVGLAVAAVPEGLPFLVTAAQLAAARRLSVRGALVRNPRTIEALGRVDVLGFDKTGTLTEGRITLAGIADAGDGLIRPDRLRGPDRLVLAAALRATPLPRGRGHVEQLTDMAVAEGARVARIARTAGARGWRRREALPFEPSRAFHATLGTDEAGALLSVKGAPEVLLARCTALQEGGDEQPLDEARRRRLESRVAELASRGYRVLAVAERRVSPASPLTDERVEGLTFLGLLALSDPVRASAAGSVTELRRAGVQILMITGDHPGTATAIASELDLLGEGRVITGVELDRLSDAELDAVLPSVAVVARSTPAHKVRVVQAFQRLGHVVAMTGDGANDAPAIRLADVGIALGRRGTPAARAAADLVVADDRLETIVAALVEGRSMWGSVRKALGILVGGNLGEIAFTVLGALLAGISPLGARQLLLVNLMTDLAPALAVALRPPEAESTAALLAEGPDVSLGDALTRDVRLRAVTTAAGAGAAWLAATALGLGAAAPTIALAALVATQLGQTLTAGGPSRGVVLSSIGSMGALVAVIQSPALSAFFGSTPLGPLGWGIAAAATVGVVAASSRSADLLPWLRPAPPLEAQPEPVPVLAGALA